MCTRVAVKEWLATVHELRFAILTVTSVLALAYVMNLSGQAATIGHFVAAAGAGLAFPSPVLAGSASPSPAPTPSANALFGALQVTAARESGLSPELLAAANSSGGVLGKMISRRTSPSPARPSASRAARATCCARCRPGAWACCW